MVSPPSGASKTVTARGKSAAVILVLVLLLTLFSFISPTLAAPLKGANFQVSVSANSTSYYGFQTVVIDGAVSPSPGPGTSAFVRIINPNDTLAHVDSVAVNGTTGGFSDSFTSGGTNWINGNYTVNVTWAANISGPEYYDTTHFFYTSVKVTVELSTRSAFYSGSQLINISGAVLPAPGQQTSVFIETRNPDSTIVHVDSVAVNGATGSFSDNFTVGGTNWINGTYHIQATWAPGINGPAFSGNTSFVYSAATAKLVTVAFTESGLAAGISWSVTFNGTQESSSGREIAFSNVPFGIYEWSVLSPLSGGTGVRYAAALMSGSMTVPFSLNESVSFTAQYQVTVSGVNGTSSPSGTAWYNASAIVSLKATPDHGYTFMTWKATNNYIVITNPLSLKTSAKIGGTGSIIANFQKPIFTNSTNTTVASNGTARVTMNSTAGKVTIQVNNTTAGSKLNITISVLMNSSGFTNSTPKGTSSLLLTSVVSELDLRVNSTVYSGTVRISYTNSSITPLTEMLYWNGTSWNYAANVTVSGTTIYGSIPVAYLTGTPIIIGTVYVAPPPPPPPPPSPTLYTVTFTEKGLPSGATWYVNITNGTSSSPITSTSYNVSLANGTYDYAVSTGDKEYAPSPSAGSLEVNGTAVSESVVFAPFTYPVTFSESGLPSGTEWYVNVTNATGVGQSFRSSTSAVLFQEPNGTYSYSIATGNKEFAPSPYPGSFTVAGAHISEAVGFSSVTYTVTFSESGIPSGTAWYVNLTNSQTFSSSSATISFQEPNGTYSYYIATGNKEYFSNGGSFTVDGASVSETVAFSLFTYSVTFTESGLPTGTPWYLNLSNGQSFSSATSTIKFNEPNGTYSYTVATGDKEYSPSPSNGSFTSGTSVLMTIAFKEVTYAATFTESGLSSETPWSVTLSGTTESSTAAITFNEPNGTYSYTVASISGFKASTYSGSITVSGSPVNISIAWSLLTYNVTITETGISAGTSWSATLTGTSFNGKQINTTLSSTTNAITFNEPNGTYNYAVHLPSGYHSTNTTGTISIAGSSASTSLVAHTLINYLLVATVIVVTIIAAAVVVVLIMRSRKSRRKSERSE